MSLTIDMASVENLPLGYVSVSLGLWIPVSMMHFGKLRALRLKGWDMRQSDIAHFLFAHKSTLVDLTIEDCKILGEWVHVLSALVVFTDLRSLKLFQLSEDFWRISFPTTSET
jgi:hypothetical protein